LIVFVTGIHVIVCVFLILVVLLQQGKGADLSVFGGGSTQTAFGARSATTLLHKLTVTSFVLFICTTMLIGILQGGAGGASVMSDVMEERLEQTATGNTEATPAEEQPAEAPDSGTVTPEAPPASPDADGGQGQ
jgi:preprotein translocase subunit SecG